MIDLLLGLQWGDEGKGKIVDVLTSKYDIVARFQGGPNAGHTLEFDQKKTCSSHHSFWNLSREFDEHCRERSSYRSCNF